MEEPGYPSDRDDRRRYREISVSGPLRRCRGQRGPLPSAQATICSGVLSEAAIVPGWHRGLRIAALWSTGVVDKEMIRAHMQVMGRSHLREICALGTGGHPHEAAKLSNA
jgi:hypothetical protein